MELELKTYLFDILNAIIEIDSFYENNLKTFDEYINDIKTKRAIERNISIIGEAMNRILKLNENIEISNSRKIVGIRNRIMHGYDSLSDDIVWGVVINYLPGLKAEVLFLLEN